MPNEDLTPSAPARRRFVVVINEESGTVARLGMDQVIETLTRAFEDEGAEVVLHLVKGKELLPRVELAAQEEADAVIVGGGDGSVASAATVLAAKGKTMGVLPLGTFNLPARDAGMPLDLAEAARALVRAPVMPIDAMEIQGRLYLCVVVMGFYPALKMASTEHHGWWVVRLMRTLGDAFRRAATFPALDLVLVRDGETKRVRTRMALIANNDYADVFGMIPQRASLDGGYFTLYVSRHKTRLGMVRSVFAWILGCWKQDTELVRVTATELEIQLKRKRQRKRMLPVMMDGEVERVALPFQIVIKPKVLRMLVPKVDEPNQG